MRLPSTGTRRDHLLERAGRLAYYMRWRRRPHVKMSGEVTSIMRGEAGPELRIASGLGVDLTEYEESFEGV